MRDEYANTADPKSEETTEKKKQDLKVRLKEYALRIIRLYESFPSTEQFT